MKSRANHNTAARSSRVPLAVVVIHVLAGIGIALWCVIFVMTLLGQFDGPAWPILLMAMAFTALHVAISWTTSNRASIAAALIWVLLVADLALAIFVTPKAGILVFASVVLMIACYRPSVRRTSYATGRSR